MTNNDTVYALAALRKRLFAARQSGLAVSDDDGMTWRSAFASLGTEIPPATAVAVAPDGTDVFAAAPGAILRSADSGENWHIARLPSPPPFVTSLTVSPNYAEDGTLFAGTAEDGVFRSGDRGRLWSSWNFGLLDMRVLTIAASPQVETLYAGVESGIFRSTNGGRAWRDHQIDFPLDYAPVLSLAITTAGVVFAGTEAHGLYRSDDRGRTWVQVAAEQTDTPVNALVVAPDETVWALLSDGLLVSQDGGETWTPHPTQIEQPMTALLVDNDRLLVGLANGEVVRV